MMNQKFEYAVTYFPSSPQPRQIQEQRSAAKAIVICLVTGLPLVSQINSVELTICIASSQKFSEK